MPKLIRQDFADLLNVSTRKISDYWSRGMPKDDLKKAREWYESNIDHSSKTRTQVYNELDRLNDEISAEIISIDDHSGLQISGETISLSDQLKVLKSEAAYLAKKLKEVRKAPQAYSIYKKMFDDTVKQTLDVEGKLVKIQAEAGEVITMEDLEIAMTKVTRKVSDALDKIVEKTASKLPKSQKAKVRSILQAEIDIAKNYFHEFSKNQ